MTSTSPTLSVVVPVYNGEKYIAEAIDSILQQTGVDFEVIIGDHSSTDNTREIVEKYLSDPRVRIIDTPAGGYVQRSWTNVATYATGTYIKLVCADDIIYPGVLARQVALLERNPTASLTACPRDVTDATGKILVSGMGLQGIKKPLLGTDAVRRVVRAGRNIFGEPGCVTMRRDAFEAAGGWFGEFPYLIDMGTYSRVLLHGDFVPDLQTGATFRLNAEQGSVSQSATQSSQTAGFHEWMHEQHPTVIRHSDVVIGNLRASINARLRRLAFRFLRRRMS
jgi:glycosyltransferase involved in cell wall biosynthesis